MGEVQQSLQQGCVQGCSERRQKVDVRSSGLENGQQGYLLCTDSSDGLGNVVERTVATD